VPGADCIRPTSVHTPIRAPAKQAADGDVLEGVVLGQQAECGAHGCVQSTAAVAAGQSVLAAAGAGAAPRTGDTQISTLTMVVVVMVMLLLLLQKQCEPDRHQRANTATRHTQQALTWLQGLQLISIYNKQGKPRSFTRAHFTDSRCVTSSSSSGQTAPKGHPHKPPCCISHAVARHPLLWHPHLTSCCWDMPKE